MFSESILDYFLPQHLQSDFLTRFDKTRAVAKGLMAASILLLSLPIPLSFICPLSKAYLIIGGVCATGLFIIKWTGNYKLPIITTLGTAYLVLFFIIISSGAIFSMHVPALYLLMLAGFCINRTLGRCFILLNSVFLLIVYLLTNDFSPPEIKEYGNRDYALLLNASFTVFFGVFFLLLQSGYYHINKEIKEKQLSEIAVLSKNLEKCKQQITRMRQNIARDFHDETGSILAAITQQSSVLKLRLGEKDHLIPVLENIASNCGQLYHTTRDFLWSIKNENDNPMELFSHLTAFGQHLYNSFEVAFSARPLREEFYNVLKIAPFVNRDLVSFFKEAMTNVVKHSGATTVELVMMLRNGNLRMRLIDNGTWKPIDRKQPHYGLSNMNRRSKRGKFKYRIYTSETGTIVDAEIPVSIDIPADLIADLKPEHGKADHNN